MLALIAVSAGLGMISPFLLRDVLDEAIPNDDDRLLALLVAGMIGVSVAIILIEDRVQKLVRDRALVVERRDVHLGQR